MSDAPINRPENIAKVHKVLTEIVEAIEHGFTFVGPFLDSPAWVCNDCSALVWMPNDPDDPTHGARESHLHWHLTMFNNLTRTSMGLPPIGLPWTTRDRCHG